MPFGGFAPLPIRLGGSAEEGLTPEQHARLCADLVACKRTSPLAVWTFTKSGATVTMLSYFGQNGVGLLYAPTPGVVGTGVVNFAWVPPSFTDPYGITYPVRVTAARVSPHGSSARFGTADITTSAAVMQVRTFDDTGTAVDCKATVRVW